MSTDVCSRGMWKLMNKISTVPALSRIEADIKQIITGVSMIAVRAM